MGLTVQVGTLVDLIKDEDPECLEAFRQSLIGINEVLDDHGLPQHVEPEQLPPLQSRAASSGYPYSFLHHLRRFYAYIEEDPDWIPTPNPDGEDPSEDPVVEEESSMLSSHLLCHSDCEGFYVPLDFEDIIMDEEMDEDEDRVEGGMLCSSHRLMEELVGIAPKLGIQLDGNELSDDEANKINDDCKANETFWIEKTVWLSLFEAARLSMEHKTAISFG